MGQLFSLLVRHGLTAVGLVGVVSPEEQTKIAGAIAMLVGVAWSIARKPTTMAMLRKMVGLSPLLFLLLGGCATGYVTFEFTPVDGGVIGSDEVRLTKMTIDPKLYARGCVAVDVNGDHVRFALQQDGTSDWIVGRAAPAMVRDAVVGAVTASIGFVSAPWEILKSLAGVPAPRVAEPSEVHGCDDLFISG